MAIVETRGLTKSFRIPGQPPVQVLKGVDLTVEPGERVAILGRSGAGKSTLLHILGGLLKPSSGTVRIPGNIGFVFQAYHLMPELTVLENVILPTYARGRIRGKVARLRARELLEQVGLADRMDHLPAELSGGERQRVALARGRLRGRADRQPRRTDGCRHPPDADRALEGCDGAGHGDPFP